MDRAGLTIKGLMEDLPVPRIPRLNLQSLSQKTQLVPFFTSVPGSAWVIYNGLPAVVANFALIVPNSLNDMTQFIHYANANNGLVILTMDTGLVANHVPTLLIGPRIA